VEFAADDKHDGIVTTLTSYCIEQADERGNINTPARDRTRR
jgi:hypothetical protein